MVQEARFGALESRVDYAVLRGSKHVAIAEALLVVLEFPIVGQCVPYHLSGVLDDQLSALDGLLREETVFVDQGRRDVEARPLVLLVVYAELLF